MCQAAVCVLTTGECFNPVSPSYFLCEMDDDPVPWSRGKVRGDNVVGAV